MAKKPSTSPETKGRACFRAVGNPLFVYSQTLAVKQMLPGAFSASLPSFLGRQKKALLEAAGGRLDFLLTDVSNRFKGVGAEIDKTVVTLCSRNGQAYVNHLRTARNFVKKGDVTGAHTELERAMIEAQKCAGTALEFCCIPLEPGHLKKLRALARKKK